jgi:hypothetical protein
MYPLIKWLMIFVGMLLLIIGLLTFPLPLPIGLPIFLVGIALLMRYSSDAKRRLLRLCKRYPLLRVLLNRFRPRRGNGTATAEDRLD